MAFGKLRIDNFQAQEGLEVDLGGLTVITGPSDRGKSSCIRALAWLLFNDAPKDCTTWGKDFCRVQLEVDGHMIIRYRDRKENYYILDGQKFSCLRTSVPPEIQNVLKIAPDNIQRQHDPVFWFSETAGEVARRLNSIVNLDVIDKVFEVRSLKARKVDAELGVLEELVRKDEEGLKLMTDVPKFQQQTIKLRALMVSLDAKETEAGKLGSLLGKIRELTTDIDAFDFYCRVGDGLIRIGDSWLEVEGKSARLGKFVARIRQIGFMAAMEIPDYGELGNAIEEFKAGSAKFNRLSKLIGYGFGKLKEIAFEEEQLRKEKILLKEKSQGRCPICGGELDGAVCP